MRSLAKIQAARYRLNMERIRFRVICGLCAVGVLELGAVVVLLASGR